jgi:hypothetical protein
MAKNQQCNERSCLFVILDAWTKKEPEKSITPWEIVVKWWWCDWWFNLFYVFYTWKQKKYHLLCILSGAYTDVISNNIVTCILLDVFCCLSLIVNVMFIYNNCFLSHHLPSTPQGQIFSVHQFFFFCVLFFFLCFSCGLLSFACMTFFCSQTKPHTYIYIYRHMKGTYWRWLLEGLEKRMNTCKNGKYPHRLLLTSF